MLQLGFRVPYPAYDQQPRGAVPDVLRSGDHPRIDRWRAVTSIRFDDIMHNPYHERDQFAWWAAHEVIDQKTRQVWQHWPMDDADIGYDGNKVWSRNWSKGNPAASMVHFFYYFVNLVWLTQDDGVLLSEVTRFDWPNLADDLYRIEMRFTDAPGVGKSYKDFYVNNDTRLTMW